MKKALAIIIILLIITGCTKEEEYIFKLEGNPSTGYEWTCIDTNDITEITYKEENTTNNKEVVGSPVIYKYIIKGIKEGKTKITCTYKRPWEETDSDIVKEYNIKVDKNLKVTLEDK